METWSNEYTQYDGQDGSYKLYRSGMLYSVLKGYFGDEFVVDSSEVEK